jgi:hypothetical protein
MGNFLGQKMHIRPFRIPILAESSPQKNQNQPIRRRGYWGEQVKKMVSNSLRTEFIPLSF